MKKRELGDYIQDILEALGEVEDFTTGMQFDDFVKDKKLKMTQKIKGFGGSGTPHSRSDFYGFAQHGVRSSPFGLTQIAR